MKLSLNSQITLNKHYGRTLNEIICGFSSKEQSELLNGFLNEYVDFFNRKTDFDILLPKFFENSFYKKQIIRNDNYRNSYIKFDNPLKYMNNVSLVDSDTILINPYSDLDNKNKISRFIKSTLTTELSYDRPFFGSYKNKKKPLFSNKIKKCFADPHYISWCIANLEYFAIDETAIEKEYDISSLVKLKVIPINHEDNNTDMHIQTLQGYGLSFDKTCSVICKPILEISKFKFNDKIKELNYENLERINMKSFSNFSHQYNEDNWLQDAAGTDDPETMNDAYWNLD